MDRLRLRHRPLRRPGAAEGGGAGAGLLRRGRTRSRAPGGAGRAGWRLAAVGLAALVPATARPQDPHLYPARGPGLTVYVTYNGFHSDLDLPAAFLAQGAGPSARAAALIAPRRWVAVGWGDAVFYQGRGFGARRLLALAKSALWPVNASVVHLQGDDDPLRPSPGWHALRLTLSPEGAEALRRRLDAAFALEAGEPVATSPAPPGAAPPERFFRSVETASAFHVCNHWTGELLNAAGVPTTPALDLTAWGLAADLRLRAAARPAPER